MADAQSKLLAELIKRSPIGIVVCDRNDLLTLVNDQAKMLLPMVPNPEGRKAQGTIPIPRLISVLSMKDDTSIEENLDVGSRLLKIRSVSLGAHGRLAILEDISTQHKAEDHRREFVANVSHELRTPATSIAGYADLLLNSGIAISEEAKDMVRVIHRNALRLNSLFKDLLTLSKIEAQSSEMPKEGLSIYPIVTECIDKQRQRAEARGIGFQVMVPENLRVYANRDAMIHIVGNLVENAVKYNRDDGLVTVRAEKRQEPNRVLLEVIDLGIGMAPSHLERIFERFFRVDKGRTQKVGGTGLGLSIVKRLVDRMDAKIEVRSRVNRGSIFRLWLDPEQDFSANNCSSD